MRFYVIFNSTPVIPGRWADDNESLCAMEPRLRVKRKTACKSYTASILALGLNIHCINLFASCCNIVHIHR